MFLLTNRRPELLAGGPGLTLERSEAASNGLLADLRSDVGMESMPESMWLSFLQLDADAGASTTTSPSPRIPLPSRR